MTTLLAKAQRLRDEGAVEEVEARVFEIVGDHGVYLATVTKGGDWSCTCPARGECSHLYAVTGIIHAEKAAAEGDPFDRFDRGAAA